MKFFVTAQPEVPERRRDEEGRDLAGAREQKRRLAAHDVEIALEREVEEAAPLGADDLALRHAQRHVRQHAQDAQVALFQRDLHRLHVEVIAEQHGQLVAPAPVHARPSAAELGVVDDVVVDERRRVDELDHGAVTHVAVTLVPEHVRAQEEQRGPDALAAALDEVVPDERDRRDAGPGPLDEDRLDVPELRLDRGERPEQPLAVLALFRRERRDEKAVLE